MQIPALRELAELIIDLGIEVAKKHVNKEDAIVKATIVLSLSTYFDRKVENIIDDVDNSLAGIQSSSRESSEQLALYQVREKLAKLKTLESKFAAEAQALLHEDLNSSPNIKDTRKGLQEKFHE